MQIYETKIISRSGNVSLQVAEAHLSDLAVIRAARTLCADGETVEIWRDDVCVYRGSIKRTRLVWPVPPEKAAS